MIFKKTFEFSAPGKSLKSVYKPGVDYRAVPNDVAALAAAKGATEDAAATAALTSAGGKAKVLAADKAARATAAKRAAAQVPATAPAPAAKGQSAQKIAALTADLDTVTDERDTAQTLIDDVLAVVNADVAEGDDAVDADALVDAVTLLSVAATEQAQHDAAVDALLATFNDGLADADQAQTLSDVTERLQAMKAASDANPSDNG